jgi:hypothetical protein
MQRSEIIARDIFAMITTPMLDDFLHLILDKSNAWSNEQISRLTAVIGEVVPDIWYYRIDEAETPAVYEALQDGGKVTVDDLLRDSRERNQRLSCLPLLLMRRNGEETLFPEETALLEPGDQLLFGGNAGVHERMKWTLQNRNALRYVQTGEERAAGYVWRLFTRERA